FVLTLDAQYLETAAAASAKIYAQMERMRRGGGVPSVSRPGKRRRSLPMPPWWGGVGPIAWRQATTALRNFARALVPARARAAMAGVSLFTTRNAPGRTEEVTLSFAGLLVWLPIFLTATTPFDFRGDVDRIEALKTLPISSARLAVGQLATPIALITA